MDTDRISHKLTFEIEVVPHTNVEAGVFPYRIVSRVFVDGKQLGCVTWASVHMAADKSIPEATIAFLDGISPEVWPQCSEQTRASVQAHMAKLREFFPFVTATSPDPAPKK